MTRPPRRRPSLRRLLFYAWLALLVANLGALGAWTLPRTFAERNLELHAERLRAGVKAAQKRNQALKARDEVAAQNDVDVQRFYRGVVGTREQTLLPVLAEIDAVARELQLNPGRQAYEAKLLKGTEVVRFSISMPVSGPYRQVVALLERLERSRYFLTVDEISLRERPQEGAGAAELGLTFSTYFRDPEAAAAEAAKEAKRGR